MLTNYVKIAFRTYRRQRGIALMNVAGLAVGLACCILIAMFVMDELAYDRFHEHADRVYRVVTDVTAPDTPTDRFAVSSRPMAEVLLEEYPEVEHAVRLVNFNATIRHDGEYFFDHTIYFTDPAFFDVFTFPLVEGNVSTALTEPYSVVLTEHTAQRYFGERSALGETMILNDSLQFTVTGIAENVPATSHFTFDLLVSYETYEILQPAQENPDWLALDRHSYILLQSGVDGEAFARRIRGLAQERFGAVLEQVGITMRIGLQPLSEIYLHSHRQGEIGPVSDARIVMAFSAIALFVLLIASINFMNLATARSVQRAKEVGIRKALGATRRRLAQQFLGESVVTAIVALVVALVLVATALPLASNVIGKELSLTMLLAPPFMLFLVALTLVVGLLAGSYPAAVLSGFLPAHVLKGRFRSSRQGIGLRKGLVIFQFAISVVLIIGTLVVLQQMEYLRSQELGFQNEHLVTVDARGVPTSEMVQRHDSIRRELLQHPAVRSATVSYSTPGTGPPLLLTVAEGMEEGDSRRMHILSTDHNYVDTYGLKIIVGRALSRNHETDAAEGALLNETAVATFGWETPEEALGKWVQFGTQQRTVVGVVRDYHHLSLRQQVEPMVMLVLPPMFNTFTLRLDGQDLSTTLNELSQTWDDVLPGYPFDYAFVDDIFDQQYQAEARLTRIAGGFALLAIGLACLGLFGLAAYTAQHRTKEIGVRKVLGATAPGIVALLSLDFIKLVLIAVVVAIPIAYLGMNHWLEDFAYRIEIGPGIFIVAGLIALTIALLTVSYHAVRAALTDPAKSLRYE